MVATEATRSAAGKLIDTAPKKNHPNTPPPQSSGVVATDTNNTTDNHQPFFAEEQKIIQGAMEATESTMMAAGQTIRTAPKKISYHSTTGQYPGGAAKVKGTTTGGTQQNFFTSSNTANEAMKVMEATMRVAQEIIHPAPTKNRTNKPPTPPSGEEAKEDRAPMEEDQPFFFSQK